MGGMGGLGSMGGMGSMGARPMSGAGYNAPTPVSYQTGPLSYETVLQQSSLYNTTVYVGNLVPYATQADLLPLFQTIGYVAEIRMQADRGFAFVKLDTHENAALAIVQLQGQIVHGRPIKCSWGKDKTSDAPNQPASPVNASAYNAMPIYGVPQANAYGGYGYTGYGADASAAGVGGMPGVIGSPASGMDVSAATSMPAAGGWTGDQQAYYQQYWGNYYGQQGEQAQNQ